MHEILKRLARAVALILVLPALASYGVRSRVIGPDRALEGSTQELSLIPGIVGQYLRRAFLSRTIRFCHPTAAISFGTIFSQTDARIDADVYIGPGCVLGRVHLERNVLVGSCVQITSGRHTHGYADASVPMREQEGTRVLVRIGEGSWIGSAAVVMADVGDHSIVGAGSVVTRPLPDQIVAAGVPARVIRSRAELGATPLCGCPASGIVCPKLPLAAIAFVPITCCASVQHGSTSTCCPSFPTTRKRRTLRISHRSRPRSRLFWCRAQE